MEAAWRTRMIAILGISSLAQRSGEEMEERVQLALAESENEFVQFNAQALVAILSALDSLVEGLVPSAREMLGTMIVDQTFKDALEKFPEVLDEPDAEEALAKTRDAVLELMPGLLDDRLGKVSRAKGVGVKRLGGGSSHDSARRDEGSRDTRGSR